MRASSKTLTLVMAICLTSTLTLSAGAAEDAEGFRSLFNGQDLTGWQIERGDPASWTVEDGAIVGRSQDYRTRSFLLTDREYSDFVLRLEFNLDQGTLTRSYSMSHSGRSLPVAKSCDQPRRQKELVGPVASARSKPSRVADMGPWKKRRGARFTSVSGRPPAISHPTRHMRASW
jgi:hypothetical protein